MCVPKLQVIPKMWVPYFLGLQSPEDALKAAMQGLVATLPPGELRANAAALVYWCLAACVRSGTQGVPKT